MNLRMQWWKHSIKDFCARQLAYRLPAPLASPLLPKYRCSIETMELVCLLAWIDWHRDIGGGGAHAICEIGVGGGYTSTFLLEHLRSTGNPAAMVLSDTFSGFTRRSVAYEVELRGKRKAEIDWFKHGSAQHFEKHLRRLGYDNFRVIAGDCEQVDWAAVGPIAVALLDVDLYLPTRGALEQIWAQLTPGGVILVDDCQPDQRWDGALQAYREFIEEHGLPYIPVGAKGGLLRKDGQEGAFPPRAAQSPGRVIN